MPKLKGRGLKNLYARVHVHANEITFRFDDGEIFEFYLEGIYTWEEFKQILREWEEYRAAHPDEVKVPKPQLFTG